MTTQPLPLIPPLTLGRRMALSMEHGGVGRSAMASRIGVDEATVSRWTHDQFKRPPARAILEVFADICGVPQDWLIDGIGSMPTPPAFPRLVATDSDETASKSAKKSAKRRDMVNNFKVEPDTLRSVA